MSVQLSEFRPQISAPHYSLTKLSREQTRNWNKTQNQWQPSQQTVKSPWAGKGQMTVEKADHTLLSALFVLASVWQKLDMLTSPETRAEQNLVWILATATA